MKQILIVINIVDEKPQITTNVTFADDSKFINVSNPENLTEKDLKFYQAVVNGINDYKD
jgi:hypothetical protein